MLNTTNVNSVLSIKIWFWLEKEYFSVFLVEKYVKSSINIRFKLFSTREAKKIKSFSIILKRNFKSFL